MEWQDAPGVRDAVLARTWCRLVIEANGRLVTTAVHGPSDSLRGGIYGSAFPLCQWIVENWWFLLHESYRHPTLYASRELAKTRADREWMQRHSLLAAREGFSLPEVILYRDGRKVVVRWRPDADAPGHVLRFIGQGEAHLEVAEVQQGLAAAVQAVIDRIAGLEAPEVRYLREDWKAILGATEQESKLCKWSARLGLDAFDPEELTDDLERNLFGWLADFDAPLRDDLLDAVQLPALPESLNWVRRAASLAAGAGPGGPPASVSFDGDHGTAHRCGYACATALRRHLWPRNGRGPIGDLDETLVRLGWAKSPSRTLSLDPDGALEAAASRSDEGAPVAVIGDVGRAGNRFRLARAVFLGHFTRSGHLHPRLATTAHTWEQRASRAFAAEFLAPAAGLAEHLGGRASPSQIDKLADLYDVSPQAIGRQIENHRLAWINDS